MLSKFKRLALGMGASLALVGSVVLPSIPVLNANAIWGASSFNRGTAVADAWESIRGFWYNSVAPADFIERVGTTHQFYYLDNYNGTASWTYGGAAGQNGYISFPLDVSLAGSERYYYIFPTALMNDSYVYPAFASSYVTSGGFANAYVASNSMIGVHVEYTQSVANVTYFCPNPSNNYKFSFFAEVEVNDVAFSVNSNTGIFSSASFSLSDGGFKYVYLNKLFVTPGIGSISTSSAYNEGYDDGSAAGYSSGYSAGYQVGVADGDNPIEVIDFFSLFSAVVTMPFTFVQQGFDFTLFAGTAYEFNAGVFLGSVLVILMIWKILQLVFKFGR